MRVKETRIIPDLIIEGKTKLHPQVLDREKISNRVGVRKLSQIFRVVSDREALYMK